MGEVKTGFYLGVGLLLALAVWAVVSLLIHGVIKRG